MCRLSAVLLSSPASLADQQFDMLNVVCPPTASSMSCTGDQRTHRGSCVRAAPAEVTSFVLSFLTNSSSSVHTPCKLTRALAVFCMRLEAAAGSCRPMTRTQSGSPIPALLLRRLQMTHGGTQLQGISQSSSQGNGGEGF